MKYYRDYDLSVFSEEDVEAVIELIKKSYLQTQEFYKKDIPDDFLYFNMYKTFTQGYCFYFARLLKSVFKDAKFVVADKNYKSISHIFILLNGYMYDISGKRKLKKYYVLTEEDLKSISENHREVSKEVYQKFKSYFYDNLKLYYEYNKNYISSNNRRK